ncbi:MAG: putative GTP-binding protein YjiA [Methanomassiliicoccales archaeon PtaB.Bin134]|jgi:G3E family GTPase|nr:MAG: putative GTP-binding protein YjiA [Methanomassiliicoccales archaeon PtaB.Bin134]
MDMVIIAGFLGSGKTSLILNSIDKISERTGKKVAVIVNDFGNIGIDGKVMEKYGLQVKELPRGCICCTLGPNFLDAVRSIQDNYHPDLVVVEPSGIADPDAILATMEHYRGQPLGSIRVVIVLDAVRFPILIQAMKHPLAKQMRVADMVVVSKTDEVDEARLAEVERYTRERIGDKPIIPVSSVNGHNLDVFVSRLVGA